jgi:NADH-quinone oxidoreductase subunit M
MIMAMLAGCGLPGFANFVGEALVFFGAWQVFPVVTALACWGALVIGAVYMIRAIRSMMFGPLPTRWESLADAGPWRKVPFVLLLASLLIFGFSPSLLTGRIQPAAAAIVQVMQTRDGRTGTALAPMSTRPPGDGIVE